MSRPHKGTARNAAEVLGVSLSTFHRSRAAATLVVDYTRGGEIRELTAAERRNRSWQKRQHLVAPALCGQQFPGRPWIFDLHCLRRQLGEEPPGAKWGSDDVAGDP